MSYKHIIYLIIDSLRYDRIGCVSGLKDKTPNIDFLMKNGVNCTNFFSTATVTQMCFPSIFSSSLPLDYGGYGKGIIDRPFSLAEILNKNGYKTYAASTNSGFSPLYGFDRGFDIFHMSYRIFKYWFESLKLNYESYGLMRDKGKISEDEFYEKLADIFDRILMAMIKECDSKVSEFGSDKVMEDGKTRFTEVKEAVLVKYEEFNKNRIKFLKDNDGKLRFKVGTCYPNRALINFIDFFEIEGACKPPLRKNQERVEERIRAFIKKRKIQNTKLTICHNGRETDDEIVDSFLERLERDKDERTFDVIHTFDLHDKKLCGRKRIQSTIFKRNKKNITHKDSHELYDYSLHEADKKVGRVLSKIEELGLQDDTLLIVNADHGSDAGMPFRPFSSGDMFFYDEYIHVPFIIYGSGIMAKNIDDLTNSTDIAPTILELAGCDVPEEYIGCSVLSDKLKYRQETYLEHLHKGPCDFERKPVYICVRTRKYKLVWREYINFNDKSKVRCELYDLENDPHEYVNVYEDEKYLKVRQSLEEKALIRFDEVRKKYRGTK